MFNNCFRRSGRSIKVMFLLCFILFLGIDNGVLCDDVIGATRHTQPVIKYHYEKENMVKSSDATLPIRDYHVVEGGYNPEGSEIIGSVAPGLGGIGFGGGGGSIGLGGLGVGGAGLGVGGGRYIGSGGGAGIGPIGYSGGIGAGGLGGAGIGLGSGYVGPIGVGVGSAGLGYTGGLIGSGIGGGGVGGIGFGGGFYGPHGYGGSSVGANQFSEGHKNLANANFEKAQGNKGQQFNNGQSGYAQGNVGVNEGQGQKGFYEQSAGGRNINEDGKHYAGGQNFNQKGANGGQKKVAQGHKKGHVIKGYKSTSHKDESGKTEEFYDEAHDEGDFNSFNGQSGQFGQQGASAYKGQHEDGKFHEAKQGKAGHSDNQYHLNKENANLGKYGSNIYGSNGAVYGLNNGIDAQSLLGHQENSKFFKHNSVPFYHHY